MWRRALHIDPVVALLAASVGGTMWLLAAPGWALVAAAAVLLTGVAVQKVSGWRLRLRALPPEGSAERRLVQRATLAVDTARRLIGSAPPGPIRQRFGAIERRLDVSADGIARLARQSVAVRALASRLDGRATGRLNLLTQEFDARAQSLVGSLEAVVAGLIEVQATAEIDPSGEAVAALERLAVEVEAVRVGLEEAQGLGGRMTSIGISEVTR